MRSPDTVSADDNLLQNPGFESGSSSWTLGGTGGTGIVDFHSHSGANSVYNSSAAANWSAWNQNTVGNLAAGTYSASCWVKSGGSFDHLSFEVYKNGTYYAEAAVSVNANWTQYTIDNINVGAGDSIRVQGYMIGHSGAWVNWDDFSLAASSTTPPPGSSMPVGDLPGWHQIFTDDFNTNVSLGNFPGAVSDKWGAYPNTWHDTSGNGTYDAGKTISVSNGILNMHLHTENGVHYVAAPYPKLPGAGSSNGQLYGRYSVRFKADSLDGYKTAWLLWPDSEVWPRDGEIDFPEGNLDGTIGAFMHRQNGTSGGDQDGYSTNETYGDWHIATTEWGPNSCTFILDGVTIGTSTNRIPNTSMHYVLQTETSLDGTPPGNSVAGNVQIDWVVVYSKS